MQKLTISSGGFVIYVQNLDKNLAVMQKYNCKKLVCLTEIVKVAKMVIIKPGFLRNGNWKLVKMIK